MNYECVIEEEDGNDDISIKLPDELMEKMGWNEHTIIFPTYGNGTITFKEKTHWTVDEAVDHIEEIIKDVSHNKTHHRIFNGEKEVVIVPYEDEPPPKWKDVIKDLHDKQ